MHSSKVFRVFCTWLHPSAIQVSEYPVTSWFTPHVRHMHRFTIAILVIVRLGGQENAHLFMEISRQILRSSSKDPKSDRETPGIGSKGKFYWKPIRKWE